MSILRARIPQDYSIVGKSPGQFYAMRDEDNK